MAAYKKSLIVLALVYLALLYVVSGFSRTVVLTAQSPPQRIISIIPSTTEMLFAMGAGPRVIGVGNFDR
jgi:ABC-type hemin transport system substrate-binding protein